MRPVCLWLSVAVWGGALAIGMGSVPGLWAEEHRKQSHQERDHQERDDHEDRDRDHKDRDDDDRDREHRDRDHQDREHEDRDRDHKDHARPHDGDHHHDGPTAARDSVNDELLDLARALRRIDQSYAYRGMQGCGAWTAGSAYRDCGGCGFGNRPHPPMVRDPGLHEGRFHQGTYLDHRGCGCALPPRPLILGGCRDMGHEDDNCSLLTRRICTGCGHVYPRHEQPHCHCHGGEAHRAPHPHADHRPHDGPPGREPTPVDREHAPPHRR